MYYAMQGKIGKKEHLLTAWGGSEGAQNGCLVLGVFIPSKLSWGSRLNFS
jgi:hypothetical protein